MRNIIIFFLFLISSINAQEMGAAATDATEAPTSSNWQNWVFAGSALVTAAIGVTVVSLSNGTTSH